MNVFISWSGVRSQRLAGLLRDWLPYVIQQIRPWLSQQDITKGGRWWAEVAENLGRTGQGIICVTQDNMHAPWLNFEAGALAKSFADASVRPLLLDLQPADLTGPLTQFQMTTALDSEDMFELVKSVNAACPAPVDEVRLREHFDWKWSDFELGVREIIEIPSDTDGILGPRRDVADMLAELLELTREIYRRDGKAPALGGPDPDDSNLSMPRLVMHPRSGS